jgi:hypothetical protein
MPFYVGLDLGQSADYTALAVIHDTFVEPTPGYRHKQLQLRHLERYPLRTSYVDIVDRVRELLRDEALHPWETEDGWRARQTHPTLIVDSTGVGAPVTDLLKKKGVKKFVSVTITGGDRVTTAGSKHYRVPKRDLVSALEVPFHSGELQVAEDLELWSTLKRELLNFKRKINLKTAHDSYEHWREGDHDDLVLACALATWYARRRKVGSTTLKVIY